MFTKHIKKLFVASLCLSTLFSCKDEYHSETKETLENQNFGENGNKIVLGRKIGLAYSLDNMQSVYDSLKGNTGLKSYDRLEATHYYVRFLPNDTAELNKLFSDTSLALFQTPFDYEIEGVGGEAYHDPTLPEDQITWQYTTVPVNYDFPDVRYEILDKLYIAPEFELNNDEEESGTNTLKSTESFSSKLQRCAFERLGYGVSDTETTDKSLKGFFSFLDPTWTPKAYITSKEDLLNKNVPLKGVKVYIVHGGVIASRTTNADGYVKFPKCIGPVMYKIEWADKYWRIYDGIPGLPVFYNGPTKRDSWNLNISGGQSLHYACIHRACYLHFYEDNFGFVRPINSVGTTIIPHKICYLNATGSGQFCSDLSSFASNAVPDIKIYRKDKSGERPTYMVFKTAVHELGHAAHCLYIGRQPYALVEDNITDAWAIAVAYKLCNSYYKKNGASEEQLDAFNKKIAYQSWPKVDNKQYSPLFVDLIDDFNQKEEINEDIKGYSLPTLQKYLVGVYNFSDIKKKLLSYPKPNGVSTNNLKTYLEIYEKYW